MRTMRTVLTEATITKMKDVWWEGYSDGNNDKTHRQVSEFQKSYDDGFYVGQQDRYASRK